jgi:hypothetical protein
VSHARPFSEVWQVVVVHGDDGKVIMQLLCATPLIERSHRDMILSLPMYRLVFTRVHFQIRAFSNVCRHHAARVCEGEGQVMSHALTTEYVF